MLPLRCSGQRRAPWSPAACTRLLFRLTGLGSIFRSSHCFPSFAFTSRLPVIDPGHSLAFDSLRRVKPTTCWVCTLPLIRSGRIRTPWPPSACTRLPFPSRLFRCRSRFVVGQVRRPFRRLFTDFRAVYFPLAGVLSVDTGLTTLLSIALRRCRPATSCGLDATPVPRSGTVLPSYTAGFLAVSCRSSFRFWSRP